MYGSQLTFVGIWPVGQSVDSTYLRSNLLSNSATLRWIFFSPLTFTQTPIHLCIWSCSFFLLSLVLFLAVSQCAFCTFLVWVMTVTDALMACSFCGWRRFSLVLTSRSARAGFILTCHHVCTRMWLTTFVCSCACTCTCTCACTCTCRSSTTASRDSLFDFHIIFLFTFQIF